MPATTDNDCFITLLRVAQEDAAVGDRLLKILRLPSFQRKSLLGGLVHEMRLKGAPTDFVAAISVLQDDEAADKALQVIRTGA